MNGTSNKPSQMNGSNMMLNDNSDKSIKMDDSSDNSIPTNNPNKPTTMNYSTNKPTTMIDTFDPTKMTDTATPKRMHDSAVSIEPPVYPPISEEVHAADVMDKFTEDLRSVLGTCAESLSKPQPLSSDMSNVDTSSFTSFEQYLMQLQDVEPIDPDHNLDNMVFVDVPTVYLRENDSGADRTTPNWRVIPYESLIDIVKLMSSIPNADLDGQISLSTTFVKRLTNQMTTDALRSKTTTPDPFSRLIHSALETLRTISSQTPYYDLTSIGLSFDRICRYESDSCWGTLTSVTDTIYVDETGEHYQLFSQLPANSKLHEAIRIKNNDTDLNRAYRTIDYLTRIVTFQPGYLCPSTNAFVNVTLGFLCLVFESKPVRGHCSNDIRAFLFAFVFDAIIRSRVITAWQRCPSSICLLQDLKDTHNPNHRAIQLFEFETAQERANNFLKLLKQTNVSDLVQNLDYETYIEHLTTSRIEFCGDTFLKPGIAILSYMIEILPSSVFPRNPTNVNSLVQQFESRLGEINTISCFTHTCLAQQKATNNRRQQEDSKRSKLNTNT